jgi:YbbR domain-containing protein
MFYHPFRHLGLKALSVVIAILLWLSVSGEQIVERSLRVPLELQNIPEKLELVDIPPASVDARVRGTSGVLSHLQSGDVVAVLDLASARPGRRPYPLTADRVHGPLGIEVTQVSPSTVPLQFEPVAVRSVRVEPAVEGQPADGFVMAGITCQPESVDVVGPDSMLQQLPRVMTDAISIAGATRPIRETVTIWVSAPGLRLKTATRATVTVDVRPVSVERVIRGVPVRMQNLAPALSGQVTPAEATVTLRGPKDAVDQLTGERLTAFVDLARLGPGRYNLEVHVEPLPHVEVLHVEPATAVVRVK